MKRFVSSILCLCILFVTSAPAFANTENVQAAPNALIVSTNTTERVLTANEACAYDAYAFSFPSENTSICNSVRTFESEKDQILSLCTLEKTVQSGDYCITAYSSTVLENYLYDCSTLVEISQLLDCLYIMYLTQSGEEVTLCYNSEGLVDKIVYESSEDIAVYVKDGVALEYINFRTGNSVEMSDELTALIYDCIARGDMDTLQEIPQISVQYDNETGSITILPSIPSSRSGYQGFTSAQAMMNSLEAENPQYTNFVKASYSKYITSLGKNVTVQVRETRNGYSVKKADWKSFAIGVTLTVLAGWYGFVVAGGTAVDVIVSWVLGAAGVAISANSTLAEAATLYRSAEIMFNFERKGYVYDSICTGCSLRRQFLLPW